MDERAKGFCPHVRELSHEGHTLDRRCWDLCGLGVPEKARAEGPGNDDLACVHIFITLSLYGAWGIKIYVTVSFEGRWVQRVFEGVDGQLKNRKTSLRGSFPWKK